MISSSKKIISIYVAFEWLIVLGEYAFYVKCHSVLYMEVILSEFSREYRWKTGFNINNRILYSKKYSLIFFSPVSQIWNTHLLIALRYAFKNFWTYLPSQRYLFLDALPSHQKIDCKRKKCSHRHLFTISILLHLGTGTLLISLSMI